MDGGNLYRYCRNDPVGHVDPDGRESCRDNWRLCATDAQANKAFRKLPQRPKNLLVSIGDSVRDTPADLFIRGFVEGAEIGSRILLKA